MTKPMKIVLAPMNIANQPMAVVNGLRSKGHIAEQVHYSFGKGHPFNYPLDNEVNLRDHGGRISAHANTLIDYLDRDFDIFHFWNKSLFYDGQYGHYTGFDIPLIKSRKKRVAYRFTGFDLRLPSWDLEVNPHSPARYGHVHPWNEDIQKKYLDFLQEHVDQFIVQDPELGQFAPPGHVVIPRMLNLDDFDFVGVVPTDNPLVVHAPSNTVVKGSKFVFEAVEELKSEGLKFEFKSIQGMPHHEAMEWYKKADIIVDQLLIGATGVLTLEALALGKPCIVNLREDLFNEFYDTSDLPIGNANPDTVKNVLKSLINDFERRKEISIRGRALVEKYHHVDNVIDKYIDVYSSMLSNELTYPKSYGDVEYLKYQATISQKKHAENSRNEKTVKLLLEQNQMLKEKISSSESLISNSSDVFYSDVNYLNKMQVSFYPMRSRDKFRRQVIALSESVYYDLVQVNDVFAIDAFNALKNKGRVGKTIFDVVDVIEMKGRKEEIISSLDKNERPYFIRRKKNKISELMDVEVKNFLEIADAIFVRTKNLGSLIPERYKRKTTFLDSKRPVIMAYDYSEENKEQERSMVRLGFSDISSSSSGVELAIGALCNLPKQYELYILGGFVSESYKEYILNLIKDKDVLERVFVKDVTSIEERVGLLRTCDVGLTLSNPILSSKISNLPCDVLDFIFAEIPIISSNISMIKAFLNKNLNGCSFDEYSDEKLAEKINELDRSKYAVAENLKKIKYDSSWNKEKIKYQNRVLRLLGVVGFEKRAAVIVRGEVHEFGRIHNQVNSLLDLGLKVDLFSYGAKNSKVCFNEEEGLKHYLLTR